MLTAAHRVYTWDRSTSSISSDRLEDDALSHLERALAVYRSMTGRSRGQVRNAARTSLEGLRPDRIEPVIRLLDDAATYAWPNKRAAAERRVRIFETAATYHPLLDAARVQEVVAAAQVPVPPHRGVIPGGSPNDGAPSASPPPVASAHDTLVAELYADYPEFHVLTAFPTDYATESLREDYDLAQAQALLYAATRVTVEAREDFKHILRYARLARLLHRIERKGAIYRFVLDGPSSVLRRTRAYGVDFARFLAGLVRLRDFSLSAEIELRKGWKPFTFELSAADGLGAGRARAPEFDSSLEEAFARRFGREREGWRLLREAAVVDVGKGALLVPDFVFRHEDGTEVLLEIVGYWTPEYLAEKFRRLRAVRGPSLIVAVPKALAMRAGKLPAAVVPFGRRLRLSPVLAQLEELRATSPRSGAGRGRPRP